MSLPPAVSVVGRDGEDHDEHADIHGGGEGGAAVPAEEHGGWSLPLTTLLSRFCSNHKSRPSLVVSYLLFVRFTRPTVSWEGLSVLVYSAHDHYAWPLSFDQIFNIIYFGWWMGTICFSNRNNYYLLSNFSLYLHIMIDSLDNPYNSSDYYSQVVISLSVSHSDNWQ